jgi:hypothetical protein
MHSVASLRKVGKRSSVLLALSLALGLSLGQGCARSEPLHPADSTSQSSEQGLPFRADNEQAAVRADAKASPDSKLAGPVPFRVASRPRILPAGTLLTVQLTQTLSAAKVSPGDSFAAAVAAPIMIDGETLIDRGAAVTGRIESTESETDQARALGYFRLTLNAVTVAGKLVPLQTSSLFAPGTTRSSSVSRSNSIRVQKGHRLTFRLIAPATLDDSATTANREFSGSPSE